MVFRCFTEKRPGFQVEATGLLRQLQEDLGIQTLTGLRLLHRYDTEGLTDATWVTAQSAVFAEPQVDICTPSLPHIDGSHRLLAVEALPGQYDQRADSAAQCIQILAGGQRPRVAYATIYVLLGTLCDADFAQITDYLINPVERRRASMDLPQTLAQSFPAPAPVGSVDGLIGATEEGLMRLQEYYGLAMDIDDLKFLQQYFAAEEGRDPTVTELRVIDTYWSDHCRHTTFGTHIDEANIADPSVQAAYNQYLAAREEVYGNRANTRPQTLMDMATIGAKTLKKRGLLSNLDESEEINACSIKVKAQVEGQTEDWLLLFKNETHNHPTEIEPFGGAATCIGGCIRDPLSGRAYVHQAMRVTGAGDPRVPLDQTIPGKLPQRKLTTTAAAGYSSYGNQIGLATGLVHELYHPGYVAKRMEVGAVVGAVPAENVVRERPEPGDRVILVGGRTGRDGCGGATGSSKSHDTSSLSECAAEVQKGNAPEERKIQRLFRKPEVARLIRRCNDFGAGGVSVAIGELADGLDIDLGQVRKKYEGLDGTEIAISESQERMAVVVRAHDVDTFIAAAETENLEAYEVATVTESPRMVMRLDGRVIVDLSRKFLSSNGSEKHMTVAVPEYLPQAKAQATGTVTERLCDLVQNLQFCSQRGLGERFDSSVGAGTVLAPFGGKTRRSPAQAMAALLPTWGKETSTASVMAFGCDPYTLEQNPFAGARDAVVESAAKLVASGCDPAEVYLTLQEYFPRLGRDPARWGLPFAALLGALEAQLGLDLAAIGGKDSMSGSFMDLDVPPTLISFAVAPCEAPLVVSPEFKGTDNHVYYFPPGTDYTEQKTTWQAIHNLMAQGKVQSARAITTGGMAEALFKLAVGNDIGFVAEPSLTIDTLFSSAPGGIVVETASALGTGILIGKTTENPTLTLCGETVSLAELVTLWEGVLEDIFPRRAGTTEPVAPISNSTRSTLAPAIKKALPQAVIPAFPGTNCEEDTARAVRLAGGQAKIVVVKNLTGDLLAHSMEEVAAAINESQMLILPGGFSGGDEPEGSAKFITAFFRNPALTEAVHRLLQNRDGLILGICNGFQALIKLGLVPYGEIRPATEHDPTLTFNLIGRHQAGYVTTRVASVNSPWMNQMQVGDLHTIPISHGEGRFVAPPEVLARLADSGQIATQYCNDMGQPTMDIDYNPNGSMLAVEGLLSPDGRVLGKMGHTERRGPYVGKNIPGNLHQPIFESGVGYFK
ncbi:MAG: phosphoribosylformylglycinamidine synthase [Oscillospiraceae bacterium]|nr:phosphoribosylformylglycinamidine synthase [Oscillospiraceae bacterium]